MFRKRHLRASLALALAMAAYGGYAQTQVSDEAGLKAIASGLSGDYVLTGDITLSGEWTPIGTSEKPFTGTLDGAGHTIKGLTVTSGADNVGLFGFIDGATVKNLRITGALVKGYKQAAVLAAQASKSEIEGVFTSGVVTGYDHIGGIVGDARGDATNDELTYITNCLSTVGAFSTTYQAGGIAGWVNAGSFTNNLFLGAVTAPTGGAAGISGMVDGGIGSYTGNVSGAAFISGGSNRTNGINGWKNGSNSMYGDNSANYSWDGTQYTVQGKATAVGDLTEETNNEAIQGSLATAAQMKSAAFYQGAGFSADAWNLSTGTYPVLKGMVLPIDADYIYINDVPDKFVLSNVFETGAVSAMGRKVTITSSNPQVVSVEGTSLKCVAKGSSTVTISTQGDSYAKGVSLTLAVNVGDINYAIATPEDLLNMKYNPAGDFTLSADIDMKGVKWEPIGEFTGTFDGKGHYIKNLTYNDKDKDRVALFGALRDATVKNLGIMNANLVGNANVAAIVGKAYGGTVSGCAVVGSYIEGRDHVASIVGDLTKDDAGDGPTVTDCVSDSRIVSRSYQAGGMAGVISAGTVQNCLFSGTVDCAGTATGMVSLVDADDIVSTIKNNMVAASHIYGNSVRIVATAGRKINLADNYALATTFCGTSSSNGAPLSNQNDPQSDQGSSVEADEARTQNFYAGTLGWDFSNTWKFLKGTEGKMFPVLKWMNAPLPSVIYDMPQDKSILYDTGMEFISLDCIHGSWGQTLDYAITSGGDIACIIAEENNLYAGNEDGEFAGRGDVVVSVKPEASLASVFSMSGDNSFSVYIGQKGDKTEIATAQQFVAINKNLGGDYVLTADIDLSGVEFTGIATKGEAFTGTLDGQGHVVRNAKVAFASGNDLGVFGKTNGATIKNIAFANFAVSASSCKHTGLVGSATSTRFEKVAAFGSVTGDDHVALLAGDASGAIVTDSYVGGTVTGGSQVGGFFGCTLESGATVTNSYYNGKAEGLNRGWVGGFVGLIDKANSTVTIQNSVSIGDCSISNGSPQVTAPFIAGNGAGDTPNAVVVFKNNVYNTNASMNASTEWPSKNETADGGEVETAQGLSAKALQSADAYKELGWDFDNTWTFDTKEGYLYPVLRLFGDVSTGVRGVTEDASDAFYAVHAAANVLTVAGIEGRVTVSVATPAGQNVASATSSAPTVKVNLPGKGLYIVTVKGNGTSKSMKIVNR